jgi:hypothetical protein
VGNSIDGGRVREGSNPTRPVAIPRQQNLAALHSDHAAWLAYKRTGGLPERVLSEGMDLPTMVPGSTSGGRTLRRRSAIDSSRCWHRIGSTGASAT